MGKNDLAVFELGLVASFCPNPTCLGCLQQEGFKRHVQGGCLNFYLVEGENLYAWDSVPDATLLCDKLRKRKAYLKKFVMDRRP